MHRTSWFKPKGKLQSVQPGDPDQSNQPPEDIRQRHQYGLLRLYEGKDPIVDIIAIHGLDGHREKTWTKGNVNWLETFLPEKIPNSRIYSWGYNSKTFGRDGVSVQSLYDHGKDLISGLSQERQLTKTERRPIIFIAHSLGGIVVKSALIHSDSTRETHLGHHSAIKRSTYGIIFLGTPHQGANGANLGKILLNIISIGVKTKNFHRHLKRDSEFLMQQQSQYAAISGDFITKFVYETYETPIAAGKYMMIVPKSSAVIPGAVNAESFGIQANHHDLVKFSSAEDPGFLQILGQCLLMVENCASKIDDVWQKWDRLQKAGREDSKPYKKYYEVPSIAVSRFFGRSKLLQELEELLRHQTTQDNITRVVLQAMGGQGKSQIALQLCQRLKKDLRGILWIDASSQLTTEHSFDLIARTFNDQVASASENKAQFVLGEIEGWQEPWLIVYDNYDQPAQYPNIRDFMPTSGKGAIIVTSRHEGAKALGRLVHVPSMVDDGGTELLLRDMPEDESARNQSLGSQIVQRLGGLALAIDQASAYINSQRMDLSAFLVQYNQKKAEILKYIRDELWEYKKVSKESLEEESLSAFATWELSWEGVGPPNSASREHITRFLTLAAFMEPSYISEYAFRAYVESLIDESDSTDEISWAQIFIHETLPSESEESDSDDSDSVADSALQQGPKMMWSEHKFWKTIEGLHRQCLVQSVERNPIISFTLHPLIRDWLQMRQKKKKNKQDFFKESIGIIHIAIEESNSTQALANIKEELLAHLDACLASGEDLKLDSQLGNRSMRHETVCFGRLYIEYGRYGKAMILFHKLLKFDQENSEKQLLLNDIANLSFIYSTQGGWKEAEELDVEVMGVIRRVLGQEYPDTLKSIGNLASTYSIQGRWKEAEELNVQVMEIMKQVLGQEHPNTLISMSNLAATYFNQGRWKEAEELEVQVIEIWKQVLGQEHPHTLTSMSNLVVIYLNQGRWKEAKELNVQVMEIRKRVFGQEHPSTLVSIGNLVVIYLNQGRWKEAEELNVQVMEIIKRVFGQEHPYTLKSIGNLAATYLRQGRWKEAEELDVQVMEIGKRVLGQEHPDTLTSMSDLAVIYLNQGRWKEAEKLGIQVVEIRKRVLGQEHPSTLISMVNIAWTLKSQERTPEALDLMSRCLEMAKKCFGIDHPHTKRSASTLSEWLAESNSEVPSSE